MRKLSFLTPIEHKGNQLSFAQKTQNFLKKLVNCDKEIAIIEPKATSGFSNDIIVRIQRSSWNHFSLMAKGAFIFILYPCKTSR